MTWPWSRTRTRSRPVGHGHSEGQGHGRGKFSNINEVKSVTFWVTSPSTPTHGLNPLHGIMGNDGHGHGHGHGIFILATVTIYLLQGLPITENKPSTHRTHRTHRAHRSVWSQAPALLRVTQWVICDSDSDSDSDSDYFITGPRFPVYPVTAQNKRFTSKNAFSKLYFNCIYSNICVSILLISCPLKNARIFFPYLSLYFFLSFVYVSKNHAYLRE